MYIEILKGLQVGQLGWNAREGIVAHLSRQQKSNNTICGAQETYRQEAQRSQEAYLSRQAVEAIPIKLEDDASETTRANAVSPLTLRTVTADI
jgi:hypothetical protein